MRFKDLAIGDVFIFFSQLDPVMGLQRGPWRKLSPRKYGHLYLDLVAQVGTVNVGVSTEKSLVYR